MTTLVWFRNDLRVADNPALMHARERGRVVACFAICSAQWREHDVGDMRLAFLARSLGALANELATRGIPLELIEAPCFRDVPKALAALVERIGAKHLVYNTEYPLNEQRRDEAVKAALAAKGVGITAFHGGVTLPPGLVLTKRDAPFTVFTPFKRRWLELVDPHRIEPLPPPKPQGRKVATDAVKDLAGVPNTLGKERWPAGEAVAQRLLETFIDERADHYKDDRDIPSIDGTSRLSPYLSVGAISSNACLHAAATANGGRLRGGNLDPWIDELIWREFYRHVVAQFPHVSKGHAFRRDLDAIRWRDAPEELAAWQAGETGYPLVDAAMRQLVETGWMHNRLRMVSAMFLTKHLLIDWRRGERFYMQHLVDGDFAANNGGWQWSASTGTDAAPYFRIFNPTTQGRRFDPEGLFTREMLPVLRELPNRFLFEPHKADPGIDYPAPIVEHKFARARAIEAFRNV
jgi:deoxyribodipyrimidine photo-lyase